MIRCFDSLLRSGFDIWLAQHGGSSNAYTAEAGRVAAAGFLAAARCHCHCNMLTNTVVLNFAMASGCLVGRVEAGNKAIVVDTSKCQPERTCTHVHMSEEQTVYYVSTSEKAGHHCPLFVAAVESCLTFASNILQVKLLWPPRAYFAGAHPSLIPCWAPVSRSTCDGRSLIPLGLASGPEFGRPSSSACGASRTCSGRRSSTPPGSGTRRGGETDGFA